MMSVVVSVSPPKTRAFSVSWYAYGVGTDPGSVVPHEAAAAKTDRQHVGHTEIGPDATDVDGHGPTPAGSPA